MKNIIFIILSILTLNVNGQNLKPTEVNDDSMNLYFGRLLNDERVKLGKQELKYDSTLKIVEDAWVESYFTKITEYNDYMQDCIKKRIQPAKLFGGNMHGEGNNSYLNRYERHFGKIYNGSVGENMLVTNSGGIFLSYDSLAKQIFKSWVNSEEHYKNMTGTLTCKLSNVQFHSHVLVVKQLKYNGTVYYMAALFMKS